MKLDKTKITPEFLIENDGKIVWIRWDYLSMRGISDDKELVEFLDYVSEVKEQTSKYYEFEA